jgi:hypothetical protein
MAELSGNQKWAIAGRAAGQMLGRRAGRSRVFQAGRHALSATWRTLSAVVRRLWHEVMGFAFLCFAIFGGFAAAREYRLHVATGADSSRYLAAGLFCLLFAWFGVSSFWRAYRPRKRN